jgi:NADPH2:quinone reductase
MKAMLIEKDQSLNWTEVPEPDLRAGEILIEVRAAALNRADLLQRQGKYPSPPGWPEWMGLEAAGVVLKAREGGRWRVGERVCALLGGGGYAERAAVPEGMAMPIPKGLSFEEAASLPEAYATSYLNLRIEAGMKAGDTVFIQAGASGLGMAAIQLAKALGAKVVTTVGSEAKAEAVRALRADVVVIRGVDDLGEALDRNPPDIAMDCVGGEGLGKNIEKMTIGGRWILISTLGGERAEIPLRPILKRGLRPDRQHPPQPERRDEGRHPARPDGGALAEIRKRRDQAEHLQNPAYGEGGGGPRDPRQEREQRKSRPDAGTMKAVLADRFQN